LVQAAIDAGLELIEQFVCEGAQPCISAGEVHFISQNTLERVSTTVTPQKVLAVFAMNAGDISTLRAISPEHSSQGEWILVADRVSDPGNLGTMIRSAVAAGAMIPPGHIQKLNTPRSFTCSTKLYAAGGRLGSLVKQWYCI
jgi:tRNA G18 (ribose-2'-O)-methylase SpoU